MRILTAEKWWRLSVANRLFSLTGLDPIDGHDKNQQPDDSERDPDKRPDMVLAISLIFGPFWLRPGLRRVFFGYGCSPLAAAKSGFLFRVFGQFFIEPYFYKR